jgi:DNA-binding HxlR family transcriptional regulator
MRVLKIIGTRSPIRIVKLLFDKKMEFRQLVN